MLKVHTAKTAAFFIAASALTPTASIAIEDCGTSRTECELRQEIKDLQRQVEKLQAAMSLVLEKMKTITVSSNGNVIKCLIIYQFSGFDLSFIKYNPCNYCMELKSVMEISALQHSLYYDATCIQNLKYSI